MTITAWVIGSLVAFVLVMAGVFVGIWIGRGTDPWE